ncbi:uncharacterized protein C10orf143 homolog isoform X2 [Larus michahellis]|uniref:uncharacterized protein C10orf143 homolog isoform X2 n=1 Tax=Larus michahellis TaxID=119627 RepID=UPI003D9B60BE
MAGPTGGAGPPGGTALPANPPRGPKPRARARCPAFRLARCPPRPGPAPPRRAAAPAAAELSGGGAQRGPGPALPAAMAARGRRGALRTHQPEPGEPERRACKPSETIPNEADAHLIDCAMELDSKQKISADCCPWATKTKQNSMIFENHVSRGTAQPCPRCIAGESGHFSHILGF